MRCICNYTFAYGDRVRAPAGAKRGRDDFGLIVGALATVGIVVAYVLGERAIPSRDDYAAGGMVLALCGVFTIVANVAGWRWYMATRRARQFSFFFGQRGARGIFAVLGGALVGVGIAMAT